MPDVRASVLSLVQARYAYPEWFRLVRRVVRVPPGLAVAAATVRILAGRCQECVCEWMAAGVRVSCGGRDGMDARGRALDPTNKRCIESVDSPRTTLAREFLYHDLQLI